MTTGRPSTFTQKIADEICETIASQERGLRLLCDENAHWPSRATIFRWMVKYPTFCDQYAKAKESQVEASVDYIQELINEPHKFYEEETGKTIIDVQLIRVKVDAIKWKAAQLKPKKYGPLAKDNAELKNESTHDEAMERKDVFGKEF